MTFVLQPTLTGTLVELRPLRSDDFAPLFQASSDPKVWEQHPTPRFELAPFKKYFTDGLESGGAFAVLDKSTREIIGSSRYYNLKPQEVTIGYTFLKCSHWGGRYNKDMKHLMLHHAFQFVECVLFDIGEFNLRSRRAIENIGAKFVQKQTVDGKPYALYEIRRTGFAYP